MQIASGAAASPMMDNPKDTNVVVSSPVTSVGIAVTFSESPETFAWPTSSNDGITQHGIDRNNAWFDSYKNGQELLASEVLSSMLHGKVIENDSDYVPKTYYYDIKTR